MLTLIKLLVTVFVIFLCLVLLVVVVGFAMGTVYIIIAFFPGLLGLVLAIACFSHGMTLLGLFFFVAGVVANVVWGGILSALGNRIDVFIHHR